MLGILGMFDAFFAVFILHLLFRFQFWARFPEVVIRFAISSLGTFVRVNAIRQKIAITSGRRSHGSH